MSLKSGYLVYYLCLSGVSIIGIGLLRFGDFRDLEVLTQNSLLLLVLRALGHDKSPGSIFTKQDLMFEFESPLTAVYTDQTVRQ